MVEAARPSRAVGGSGLEEREAGKGWWEGTVVVGGRIMANGERGRRSSRVGVGTCLTYTYFTLLT